MDALILAGCPRRTARSFLGGAVPVAFAALPDELSDFPFRDRREPLESLLCATSFSRTLSTATLLGAVTRTFQPLSYTALRISSTTVEVFPVPGGPWINPKLRPPRAKSMASSWLESRLALYLLLAGTHAPGLFFPVAVFFIVSPFTCTVPKTAFMTAPAWS